MPSSLKACKSSPTKQTDKSLAIAQAAKEVEADKANQDKPASDIIETKRGRMPSALVSMSRDNFPVLQQKIFLSLVYAVTTEIASQTNAADKIVQASETQDVKDDWVIDAKLARRLARYKSRNFEHFRQSVMALNGRTVKPNILGKDDEELLDTRRVLFEGVGFVKDDSKIYFKFSEYVKIKVERLRFYCKFLPYYANSLKRTSSHAIYLLLSDYIDENRGEGQTPFIEIEKFAELVGGEKNLSSDFGSLRKYSIEPAIDEINRETDITAFFDRHKDVKRNGRKITEIRLRGRYNNKDYLDANPSDSASITLCGRALNKDDFLDFLAKDANNRGAYRHRLATAFGNGTLGDLRERVSKYIVFRNEQEKIVEAKRLTMKIAEFYKRLSDIAVKIKKAQLERLEVLVENGFTSIIAIINENKLVDLAHRFQGLSDADIAQELFTSGERDNYEAKEIKRYQKTIIEPLAEIEQSSNWTAIIDNQETKLFHSTTMIEMTGKRISLSALRKIELMLRQRLNVVFKNNGASYLGTLESDGKLILKPVAQNEELTK
jgi:hypothetical protein